MRKKIEEWFAGSRDYAAGVTIYSEYGKNAALKTLLSSGETRFSRTRLESALKELNESYRPVPKKYEKPQYDYTELSNSLQQEYRRKGRLYSQASRLHAELYYESAPEKLKEIRDEITRLFDEIDRIWKKCDKFIIEKRGREWKPHELLQHRNNLRSQISKAKKKNDQLRLPRLLEELAEVETKLDL